LHVQNAQFSGDGTRETYGNHCSLKG